MLGVYADRKGRKAALNLTIMLMALGTGLIAIAPTYAQVGVAAPLLVVFARLMQGFAGRRIRRGDVDAARTGRHVAPRVPRELAARDAGWRRADGPGFAALLSNTMTKDALEGWGWRLPFLVGVLIAPVGMFCAAGSLTMRPATAITASNAACCTSCSRSTRARCCC